MKTTFIFISILICQQTLWSQDENPAYFLWKVSINESEFILAGSVHSGRQELLPPSEAYMEAYKQADITVFELKDDKESLKKMIFNYAAKDSLGEEQYIDKLISNESREKLALLFMGREDVLSRYYHYEAWLLNMAISGRRSVLIGYNPDLPVDMYFHNLAVRDKRKIIGLDEIETQLKLFEFDVPLETQVKIIESATQRIEEQARLEQPLFDNYYNHDLKGFKEAFLTLINLENPQQSIVYDRVFVSRNKAWVKKLIELSSSQPGTYFVLVGSGHYFGPDNVLELIEREGYNVKPFIERSLKRS